MKTNLKFLLEMELAVLDMTDSKLEQAIEMTELCRPSAKKWSAKDKKLFVHIIEVLETESKRRSRKSKGKKKVPKCANCDSKLTAGEDRNGKGYCGECLMECFGEDVTSWPEEA